MPSLGGADIEFQPVVETADPKNWADGAGGGAGDTPPAAVPVTDDEVRNALRAWFGGWTHALGDDHRLQPDEEAHVPAIAAEINAGPEWLRQAVRLLALTASGKAALLGMHLRRAQPYAPNPIGEGRIPGGLIGRLLRRNRPAPAPAAADAHGPAPGFVGPAD